MEKTYKGLLRFQERQERKVLPERRGSDWRVLNLVKRRRDICRVYRMR